MQSPKSVSVEYYDFHIAYLLKKDKEGEDCTCTTILGKKHMWGFINKSNVSFYKKMVFHFTDEESERFSEAITQYFDENSTAKSHHVQLSRPCGRLGLMPPEIVSAACRYAMSKE